MKTIEKTEYFIIHDYSLSKFISAVNEHLENGWEIVGHMQAYDGKYCQTMIRTRTHIIREEMDLESV